MYSGFNWLRKQANLFAEFWVQFLDVTANTKLMSVHMHYKRDIKNEVQFFRSSERRQSEWLLMTIVLSVTDCVLLNLTLAGDGMVGWRNSSRSWQSNIWPVSKSGTSLTWSKIYRPASPFAKLTTQKLSVMTFYALFLPSYDFCLPANCRCIELL